MSEPIKDGGSEMDGGSDCVSKPISVWAYHQDFGTLCEDARLGGRSDNTEDTPEGQAGWDVAIRFRDLADLASQFKLGIRMPSYACTTHWFRKDECPTICIGKVKRLAIMAHGDVAGEMHLGGQHDKNAALTNDTVGQFRQFLEIIGKYTISNAEILLMGCIVGRGEKGSDLLKTLSAIWPGRSVVGFTTIGYRFPKNRRSEYCVDPGMRELEYYDPVVVRNKDVEIRKMWNDLKKLPWASEKTPHAKIGLNGKIIKQPSVKDGLDDPSAFVAPTPRQAPPTRSKRPKR